MVNRVITVFYYCNNNKHEKCGGFGDPGGIVFLGNNNIINTEKCGRCDGPSLIGTSFCKWWCKDKHDGCELYNYFTQMGLVYYNVV